MKRRYVQCCRCELKMYEGQEYDVYLGNVYCKEHGDEFLKNEIAEHFEQYRDQFIEIVGGFELEV